MAGKGRRAAFLGVGRYAPEKVLTNFDLEKMVDTTDEWIIERTGIRERRIASDDQAASDLAVPAALNALEAAGVSPEELDLILLGTVTPDYFFPSTACVVQNKIGARNAAALDTSVGCSAFIYGCNIASQFIETGRYEHILVIGVETLSKLTDYTDRNTCVLFGDGAGAAVLGPARGDGGILATHMKADGSLGYLLEMPGGGSRQPPTHESLDAKLHYIKMAGREVFKNAVRSMVEAGQYVLDEAGYTGEDVDLLIPHQANWRIMSVVADKLKIPHEKVFVNLDKYGNTSAASIPIALSEAVEQGRVKAGDLVLNVAFGAGFTWAANLVRWE
ncbi:MAG TPA: beta-ketoacyl-ACP synthase III [bacterium]|nr:beta-ketoacyl-ACP synthase III [bacterium]